MIAVGTKREVDIEAPATVDGYMAALPDGQRASLQKLRETIRAAAPEATETLSYHMPAFKDQGRILVYYAAFKDHYSLFPASVAVIESFGEELEPFVSGKGTIRFGFGKRLPVALVKKIVKARLEENAARRRK